MHKLIKIAFILGLVVSCSSNSSVGDSQSLPGYWNSNEEVSFVIPEIDSLKKYDVFLHVRNTNDYPYNNIFLIVSMKFPHGKTITDTLEYRMAEADGTWLGKGIGDVKENKLWYKEGVSFYEEGNYMLTVSQAVRNNGNVGGVSELQGITEVGYSIEEVIE